MQIDIILQWIITNYKAVSHLKSCRRRLRPHIPAVIAYLIEKNTLLLVNHAASSVRGHKQKEHWFSLELQQKNPSFCKLAQSSQVPVMLSYNQ